jgi:hypothetical protein
VIRPFVPLMAAVVAMMATAPASGQDDDVKSACLSAHEQGQIARKSWKFAAAHAQFSACAQENCPGLVRADCVAWLAELETVYPSVVFDAYIDGRQALGARAFADGVLATDRIDGKAVKMDPGRHLFRIEVVGFPPNEQELVLSEGAHERVVTASFDHPKADVPPRPASHRPVPRSVWIAGGVAVAAGGALAILGAWALVEKSDLQGKCGPFCSDNQLSTLHTAMRGADVSLGVAAAGVLAGGLFFFWRPEVEGPPQSSVSVTPARGGGFVSVDGRF